MISVRFTTRQCVQPWCWPGRGAWRFGPGIVLIDNKRCFAQCVMILESQDNLHWACELEIGHLICTRAEYEDLFSRPDGVCNASRFAIPGARFVGRGYVVSVRGVVAGDVAVSDITMKLYRVEEQ